MVVGGFSLATWLTEKLSNEVTNRVRATNRRIGERFGQLAHRQIDKLCEWLDGKRRRCASWRSWKSREQEGFSTRSSHEGRSDEGTKKKSVEIRIEFHSVILHSAVESSTWLRSRPFG